VRKGGWISQHNNSQVGFDGVLRRPYNSAYSAPSASILGGLGTGSPAVWGNSSPRASIVLPNGLLPCHSAAQGTAVAVPPRPEKVSLAFPIAEGYPEDSNVSQLV